MKTSSFPSVATICFASIAIAVVGCGKSTPYDVVYTKGVIKYDDGSVIPAGRIELRFVSQQPPIDPKTHPRMGIAEVDVETGQFEVSTYAGGDGLIAGKHKVSAMAMDAMSIPIGAIPRLYHSPETSPLEVDTNDIPLELVVEKPK